MRLHGLLHGPLQDTSPVWVNDDTWQCCRHVPSARFPASVERCLYGCNVNRPERPAPAPPVVLCTPPEPLPWAGFDDMDVVELEQQSIRNLRKYAVHVRGIPRASKIRGGKAVLIPLLRPPAVPTPKKRDQAPPKFTPWDGFEDMDAEGLRKQTMYHLRKYAIHGMGIIGAAHMRGGKTALIQLLRPLSEVPKAPVPVVVCSKPGALPWAGFNALDAEGLEQQSIRNLRKYAGHALGIQGASKIRGGKAVLIPLILAKRL